MYNIDSLNLQLFYGEFRNYNTYSNFVNNNEYYKIPTVLTYSTSTIYKVIFGLNISNIKDIDNHNNLIKYIMEKMFNGITIKELSSEYKLKILKAHETNDSSMSGLDIIDFENKTTEISYICSVFCNYLYNKFNSSNHYGSKISNVAKKFNLNVTKIGKLNTLDISPLLINTNDNIEFTAKMDTNGYKIQRGCMICKLMNDMEKDKMSEFNSEKLIGVTSNISNIAGGHKLINNAIKNSKCATNKRKRMEIEFRESYNLARSGKLNPKPCNEFCEYSKECNGSKTILEKINNVSSVERFVVDRNFVKISQAERYLNEKVSEALNAKSDDEIVHIIKAQTGLGKTEAYCEYIERHIGENRRFFVAVPTNKLKHEIGRRLSSRGVDVILSKSIYEVDGLTDKDKEYISQLYRIGSSKLVREKMKKLSNNNEELFNEIEDYLNFMTNLRMNKYEVVISTHSQLIYTPSIILSGYEVISDEDILKTIIKSTSIIYGHDVARLLASSDIKESKKELLSKLEYISDNLPDRPVKWENKSVYVSPRILIDNNINSKINSLQENSIIWYDSKSCTFTYFYPYRLDNIPKIIVLSATADVNIYTQYFHNKEVKYDNIPKVEYTGKVIQFVGHSCSRNSIENYGVEELYKAIHKEVRLIDESKSSNYPVITFKQWKSRNIDIYFEKLEGFNELKGQNIIIVGTPHTHPCMYYMLAFAIAGSIKSSRYARYKAVYDNTIFTIMSYENQLLKNIQLYLVSSELEQAVGRSRVLRENCTVYLFSDFPVEQSYIIEKRYLLPLQLS